MKVLLSILISGMTLMACNANTEQQSNSGSEMEVSLAAENEDPAMSNDNLETITLGNGCFWCTEAIFSQLEGVVSATSGYMGGSVKNPTYKEVCTGNTGHAEVIQVVFDPTVVRLDAVLEVYWKTHDPTTLNRQGADVGTQYRSVIFYHNEKQKETAEAYKKKLDEAGIWDDPIVTAIEPYSTFYKAEDYHQDYFANNPEQAYCKAVILPKVEKFKEVFSDKLKD